MFSYTACSVLLEDADVMSSCIAFSQPRVYRETLKKKMRELITLNNTLNFVCWLERHELDCLVHGKSCSLLLVCSGPQRSYLIFLVCWFASGAKNHMP